MSLRDKTGVNKQFGFPKKGLNRIIVTSLELMETYDEEVARINIKFKTDPNGIELSQSLGGKIVRNDQGKITSGSVFDLDDIMELLKIEAFDNNANPIKSAIEGFRNPRMLPNLIGYCYESGKKGSDKLFWGLHRSALPLDANQTAQDKLINDFERWQAYMIKGGYRIFQLENKPPDQLAPSTVAPTSDDDDDVPF